MILLAALISGFAWFKMRDLIAVQEAVARDWEIDYGYGSVHTPHSRPAALPALLDDAAEAWLDWVYRDTRGYTAGRHAVKTRNRNSVYHDQFRALFRGSIEEIHIYYPESFRPELTTALARFPQLRRFSLVENESTGPTEAEWMHLCTGLRALPQLEELELCGYWLTDEAIAPLAEHPGLRSIVISEGRLSAASSATFASIPRLKSLNLGELHPPEGEWRDANEAQATRGAFEAALPGVSVQFP